MSNDSELKVPENNVINIDEALKVVLTLENTLIPKDKCEFSPSVRDGLDLEVELQLRAYGCELVQVAGILLKLPQVAMATGQVLFQRFYYCQSFVRHPLSVTAMGCLYLASKIEECPRRLRDVLNVVHHIQQVQRQQEIKPLVLDREYIILKNQVIKSERRILKELGFCVHVKHPHKLIMLYLQLLHLEKNNMALMQTAWNYMNDALRTNAFVQFSPETVACACIYLSVRRLRIIMPKEPTFYEIFGMSEGDIKCICKKITKLYKKPLPRLEVLEEQVSQLRIKFDEEREKSRVVTATASGNNTPNGHGSHSEFSPDNKENRHVSKRSRSASRSRSPRSRSRSRSRTHSYSKSRSGSDSSSYKRRRNRDFLSPDRKSRKTRRSKYDGYSSPIKDHHKKLKYKRSRSISPISRSYNDDRYYYKYKNQESKSGSRKSHISRKKHKH